MCGIFGFATNDNIRLQTSEKLLADLFILSESRGKEASGLALLQDHTLHVFKRAIPAHKLIKSKAYRQLLSSCLSHTEDGFSVIGHSRLVTNGSEGFPANNQPVTREATASVHNGILVNVDDLWKAHPELVHETEVDSEVFVALLESLRRQMPLPAALYQIYHDIHGMASTISLFADTRSLVAATNNGSLYYCLSKNAASIVFASESATLKHLLLKNRFAGSLFQKEDIRQLASGQGLFLAHPGATPTLFSLSEQDSETAMEAFAPCSCNVIVDIGESKTTPPATPLPLPEISKSCYAPFEIDEEPIRKLRRCTRCVLPETMPFIEFDEEGVCNYCKSYTKQEYMPAGSLEKWASGVRHTGKSPDSIVSFSGGRDSSYGLHYFVKELGLHPVAYSYDWGMVTDLARRNQSRMCAKLGVELILISADIKKKRDNIRRNVSAWLKKPDLGMVPLFMAGDKHYFYYANQVRKEYGLDEVLMASNPFEKTHFKSGFCGVKPAVLQKAGGGMELEELRISDVLRMGGHYMGQYLTNPRYINRSLIDTATATLSYYAIPHNYFRFFNYVPWDEKETERVLLSEYDWEKSPDTQSTWRIGDGTAPFYNYIYYYVAGFTENDTLRSNQIREGMLSREEALALVYRDNRPRFPSMQWYFDAIGLNMEDSLAQVRKIPQLYEKK